MRRLVLVALIVCGVAGCRAGDAAVDAPAAPSAGTSATVDEPTEVADGSDDVDADADAPSVDVNDLAFVEDSPFVDADGNDLADAVAPRFYGDDPTLDELWDACDAGDDGACDELWWTSPVESEYEAFAATCGGRASQDHFAQCAERN